MLMTSLHRRDYILRASGPMLILLFVNSYKLLKMVVTFYWHPLSPPAKVVWSVLETLRVPYEKKFVDLLENRQQRTPEYLAINPDGKVPYIVDGDFGLGESRAIISFLCSKYESNDKKHKLYPTDLEERATVDKALYQDFQYFSSILEYFNVVGVIYRGEAGPIESRWPAVENSLDGLERRLAASKYMAGDYMTLADFSAMATVAGLESMVPQSTKEKHQRLFEWKREMESLPMYDICYGDSVSEFKIAYSQLVQKNKEAIALGQGAPPEKSV